MNLKICRKILTNFLVKNLNSKEMSKLSAKFAVNNFIFRKIVAKFAGNFYGKKSQKNPRVIHEFPVVIV